MGRVCVGGLRGEQGRLGLTRVVGVLPCKAQSSFPGLSSAGCSPKLPEVDTFPFNYSATCIRICSPGRSWGNTRG